jgi:hypothetical protein
VNTVELHKAAAISEEDIRIRGGMQTAALTSLGLLGAAPAYLSVTSRLGGKGVSRDELVTIGRKLRDGMPDGTQIVNPIDRKPWQGPAVGIPKGTGTPSVINMEPSPTVAADRLLAGKTRGFNARLGLDPSVLAHELGHIQQHQAKGIRRMLTGIGLKRNVWKNTEILGLLGALYAQDEDHARFGAMLGSASAAPVLWNEIDASRRGSKLIRDAAANSSKQVIRRLGRRAYLGVPTYGMAAALPWLTYAMRKRFGGFREEGLEKQARGNSEGVVARAAGYRASLFGAIGALLAKDERHAQLSSALGTAFMTPLVWDAAASSMGGGRGRLGRLAGGKTPGYLLSAALPWLVYGARKGLGGFEPEEKSKWTFLKD